MGQPARRAIVALRVVAALGLTWRVAALAYLVATNAHDPEMGCCLGGELLLMAAVIAVTRGGEERWPRGWRRGTLLIFMIHAGLWLLLSAMAWVLIGGNDSAALWFAGIAVHSGLALLSAAYAWNGFDSLRRSR